MESYVRFSLLYVRGGVELPPLHCLFACAHLEIAPPGIAPVEDDCEFFVAAWCLHSRFILDEQTIFISEPNLLISGAALYLQADDVVLNWLPGLKYH
jgi:hypothetical protein